MTADRTPDPRTPDEPGRRDERPLPRRRPGDPHQAGTRGPWPPELRPPYPPPRPRTPRPRRTWLHTLAIVVISVLSIRGLMAIAFTIFLYVALNNITSNK
jgi:hypothetical protein